jgi:VWFA-related protein
MMPHVKTQAPLDSGLDMISTPRRPPLAAQAPEVEPLAREMATLRAEGGTALWDSVVFTLHHFNGISGQRAVLLLSDGEDQSSRFTFEEALAYAQSAGVTLYAIGLDLEAFAAARGRLGRLADATGGRAYFIDEVAELEEVYSQIERELRSKYLIVYQSSNDRGDDGFRRVELRVLRPGLEVRTIQGYFP